MLVSTILKSKDNVAVVSVQKSTTIAEVAKILADNRIGGVLVSETGKSPDGILSERDIVRALNTLGGMVLSKLAGDLMTPNPQCCTYSDKSEDVLQRMTDGRFRHMPVVENGELVGVVTIGDVVKARMDELAMEKDAMQGMIMGH